MDDDDSVAGGSHLKGLQSLAVRNRKPTLYDCFGSVARPAVSRGKNHAACCAVIVAEAGDVNVQRAERLASNGSSVVTSRIAPRRNLRDGQNEE